ncbi:MAG: SPW repeat protein [Pirellulaceae bacterium]
MWSRVVEIMLGCWLAVSPFIFGHAADAPMLWWMDWICALAVISFGMLSYWQPLRHIHVATALVALVMIGYGRFASPGDDVTPALQNHILVGLLLLMFAIVPNHASRPPRWWHSGAVPSS